MYEIKCLFRLHCSPQNIQNARQGEFHRIQHFRIRITELEETTRGHRVQPPTFSGTEKSLSPDRCSSNLLLKTSNEGDSTTLRGSRFHLGTALTVRKCFLLFIYLFAFYNRLSPQAGSRWCTRRQVVYIGIWTLQN